MFFNVYAVRPASLNSGVYRQISAVLPGFDELTDTQRKMTVSQLIDMDLFRKEDVSNAANLLASLVQTEFDNQIFCY